ncbi:MULTISPECIES: acyl carrier protein [unclassified Anaerococcus]|uniref:acyl carrier protein n=1 Tax=unclassified Anaerococcus TaxID=2614126 RepID=UPI000C06A6CB|nr:MULTISPECIES: phosphopantetheine-binding protein [unclassified Anaerococcus]
MIRDELIQLANENLDIDLSDVQMNTKLSDLDIDSIDMLDFIMLLEEKYNIEFAEDELDEIETLGDIAELIESKN